MIFCICLAYNVYMWFARPQKHLHFFYWPVVQFMWASIEERIPGVVTKDWVLFCVRPNYQPYGNQCKCKQIQERRIRTTFNSGCCVLSYVFTLVIPRCQGMDTDGINFLHDTHIYVMVNFFIIGRVIVYVLIFFSNWALVCSRLLSSIFQ